MITKDQALTARTFHRNGCRVDAGPRGGRTVRLEVWRRNGATQTWKRRPDDWSVPVKFGLYAYGRLTQDYAGEFHVPAECPEGLS